MKRKYRIEAYIAAAVIALILSITLPSFQRVQVKSQPEALQLFVEDAVRYFARGNNYKKILHFRGVHSSGWSNGYLTRDSGKIMLRFQERDSYFEKDNFLAEFNDYPGTEWNLSNLSFIVTTDKSMHPNDSDPQSTNFEDKPCVISVTALVGANSPKTDWLTYSSPFHITLDDNDFIKVERHITPYSMSNGVTSFGAFYADTSSIWPKKKAVILTPPPGAFPGASP